MAKSQHFDDSAHKGESSSAAGGLSEDRPLDQDPGQSSEEDQTEQSEKFMKTVKKGGKGPE